MLQRGIVYVNACICITTHTHTHKHIEAIRTYSMCMRVCMCLAAIRECVLVQKFQINSLHTYTNGVSVRLGFRFSIDASFVVILISVFCMSCCMFASKNA